MIGKTTGKIETTIVVRWSDSLEGSYEKNIIPRFNCNNIGNELFKICVAKRNTSALDHFVRIVEEYVAGGKNDETTNDQIFSKITNLALQIDEETKVNIM